MKRVATFIVLVAFAVGMAWAAEDRTKELERVQAAGKVLNEIMAAPDKGIPQEILSSADCVAVVPSLLKGGFIVGGAYGKGVATCRTAKGQWSAPAPFRIEGGSLGLQIGGQAVDLVMLVMNKDGMENLLSSKFKIGADASAAAGPVGRHVEGTTDWKMRAQVLSYSRARGAFAGITLDGAVVKQDTDDTLALYGKDIAFRQILSGQAPPPAGTQTFLAEVARYFREARAEERAESKAEKPATGGMSGTFASWDKAWGAENAQAPATASQGAASSNIGANAQSGMQTGTGVTTETSGGQNVSSSDVKQQIETRLHNAAGLSSSNISVDVTDDTVELSGSVPNQNDKLAARRIAMQQAGNRRVNDDKLIVK